MDGVESRRRRGQGRSEPSATDLDNGFVAPVAQDASHSSRVIIANVAGSRRSGSAEMKKPAKPTSPKAGGRTELFQTTASKKRLNGRQDKDEEHYASEGEEVRTLDEEDEAGFSSSDDEDSLSRGSRSSSHPKERLSPKSRSKKWRRAQLAGEKSKRTSSLAALFELPQVVHDSLFILPHEYSFACVTGYLATILTFVVTFMICWSLIWQLPKPLANDAVKWRFSEGRAWEHLVHLQSIGPSLVGTKSNIAVSDYIESTLHALKASVEQLVREGVLKHAPTSIEIELQRPSGALNFEIVNDILTNHYTRLHNVLIRMSWTDKGFAEKAARGNWSPRALLVNSHFDSGLSSPGAMDARACNAVMLEMVRALAHGEVEKQHPIIFLFNGAEESLQEGSHGFITQHEWKEEVGGVLNFDAGGIGGPEILFQVGSGEYAELYASVAPRLHGAVLAQDLFDTGLLQGDTDYRIFRDYGDVHGLDLAWYKDGYKYHTPRDDLNWVEEGCLQHTGDNALAYVHAILSNTTKGTIWRDDYLKAKTVQGGKVEDTHGGIRPDLLDAFPSRSQVIFFDYLGLFTIHYSPTLAHVLHAITLMVTGYCLSVALPLKQLIKSTLSVYASLAGGVLLTFVVALFMTMTGKVMSWFANQSVMIILYLPPFMLGCLVPQIYRSFGKIRLVIQGGTDRAEEDEAVKRSTHKTWQLLEYEMMHGVAGWSLSILLLWASARIMSTYLWLFSTLACLLAISLTRHFGLSHQDAVKQGTSMVPWYAYLAFWPAMALLMQVSIQIMTMAFPMSGRLPPFIPIELVIPLIFIFLIMNCLVFTLPLIHRFGHFKSVYKVLLLLIVIGILVGSLTFPYSPYRPKRITMQHTYRTEPFPGHPTLDEPAVLFALCDAGPSLSLVKPLIELDSRGVSPHRDVHDWDTVFPFSALLSGYSLPAPMPTLRPPHASVLRDEWNATLQERYITLKIDYSGSEWSTLKFEGPLKRWNLTEVLPPPSASHAHHMVRHIGEHGLTYWGIELVFGDQKPRRYDFTVAHFVSSVYAQAVLQTLPDWVAPLSFTSAMSHLIL